MPVSAYAAVANPCWTSLARDSRSVQVAIAWRAIGLSNVFWHLDDPVMSYAGAASAARSTFPGRPLVGYERDDDLERAVEVGFQVIGPLRVWLKA